MSRAPWLSATDKQDQPSSHDDRQGADGGLQTAGLRRPQQGKQRQDGHQQERRQDLRQFGADAEDDGVGDIEQLRQDQRAHESGEDRRRRPIPGAAPTIRQGRGDPGGDQQGPAQHEGDQRRSRLKCDAED